MQNRATNNGYFDTKLFRTIKNGSVTDALVLIKYFNIDPNAREGDEDYEHSLLHAAVLRGEIDIIKALLQKNGIDPHIQRKKDGLTPLMLAIKLGHVKAVKEIVHAPGIDFYIRSKKGRTVLWYAANYGNFDIRELFGINTHMPTAVDPQQLPEKIDVPLFFAVQKQLPDIVQTLVLEDKMNPNISLGFYTPLTIAIKNNDIEIANILLQSPTIDVNFAPECGRTALELACAQNNTEMVNLLLKVPNIDVYKRDPLNHALLNKNQDVIKALLLLMKQEFLKDNQLVKNILKKVDKDEIIQVLTKDEFYVFLEQLKAIKKTKILSKLPLTMFHHCEQDKLNIPPSIQRNVKRF